MSSTPTVTAAFAVNDEVRIKAEHLESYEHYTAEDLSSLRVVCLVDRGDEDEVSGGVWLTLFASTKKLITRVRASHVERRSATIPELNAPAALPVPPSAPVPLPVPPPVVPEPPGAPATTKRKRETKKEALLRYLAETRTPEEAEAVAKREAEAVAKREAEAAAAEAEKKELEHLPPGYYAASITDPTTGKVLGCVRFCRFKSGLFAKPRLQFLGDPQDRAALEAAWVKGAFQDALRAVVADPSAAMALYGRTWMRCAVCGRGLTDPESKLRGIGPECWKDFQRATTSIPKPPPSPANDAEPPNEPTPAAAASPGAPEPPPAPSPPPEPASPPEGAYAPPPTFPPGAKPFLMDAQYDGNCARRTCNQDIKVGERIWYDKPNKKAAHERCYTPEPFVPHPPPVPGDPARAVADDPRTVTVLHSVDDPPRVLTKRHGRNKDGTNKKPAVVKFPTMVRVELAPVHDPGEFYALLCRLENMPHACIARGAPVQVANLDTPRRRLKKARPKERAAAEFIDVPRKWKLYEVDGMTLPEGVKLDAVADPVGYLEYMRSRFPERFHKAACVARLSASAGLTDAVKGHLWCLEDRAETLEEQDAIVAEFAALGISLDPATFQPNQPHFVARPIFEDGRTDPLPVRTFLLEGAPVVELGPAPPPATAKGEKGKKGRPATPRPRPEGAPEGAGWLVTAFGAAGWVLGDVCAKTVVRCPWEAEHSSDTTGTDSTVIFEPSDESPDGKFHCSHTHCRGKRSAADVRAKLSDVAKAYADTAFPDPSAWREALQETDEGKVRCTTANVIAMLTLAPEWKGVLRFNAFADRAEAAKQPPWYDESAEPGVWTEQDDVRLVVHIERVLGFSIEPRKARAAVENVARRSTFNPIVERLSSLVWDGTKRVNSWMSKYLGAVPSAYVYDVGRCFLVGAVARAFEPGCKNDDMTVLEGKQGTFKSTAMRVLFGEEYFADTPLDMDNKDRFQQLQNIWGYELAELESFNRTEASHIKAFLSSPVDNYRRSYGAGVAKVPRRCVIVGTVNLDDYLKDTTGNRRFLPIRCGTIDIKALEQDREQLWAEAVALYDQGRGKWWLDDADAKRRAAQEQGKRLQHDAWHEGIVGYIDRRRSQRDAAGAAVVAERVTLDEILSVHLGLDPKDRNQTTQNRVAGVLRVLGWERKPGKRTITGSRPWHYQAPDGYFDAPSDDE